MTLIPVIDLLQSRAVLGHLGRRERYRPIDSPLCRNGDALALVERFVMEFGFTALYVADLDAIQRTGSNAGTIDAIHRRFPSIPIWIDAGFRRPADIDAWKKRTTVRPVVGSETWQHAGPVADSRCLLSIDIDQHGVRDPSGVTDRPDRYPRDIILMNLARVGAQQGPDLALLRCVAGRVESGSRLYLAGGIRNRDDLDRVHDAGAAGVLLASALHQGRISAADVRDFD